MNHQLIFIVQFILSKIIQLYFTIEVHIKKVICFFCIPSKHDNNDWIIIERKNNKYFERVKMNENTLLLYKNSCRLILNDDKKNQKEISDFCIDTRKQKSTVSFIYIEYSYVGIIEPIRIIVDIDYLYVGNEILSHEFIWMYLKYNYGLLTSFHFDYQIDIIISCNNDMITLKNTDYLLLDIDDVTVKHRKNIDIKNI